MVGFGLDLETAEDEGMVKNHWMWRVQTHDELGSVYQISFGFRTPQTGSVGSNEAVYAHSTRASSGSDSDYAYSNFGSKGGVPSDIGSLGESGAVFGKSSIKGDIAKASDAESVGSLPSVHSSNSSIIYQPVEGAPADSVLSVEVRRRTGASWGAYFSRSFALKQGTTFGELLLAMTSRNMEGFRFRKIGSAFLGCRDGISQAAAAWLADGLMLDPSECLETPYWHLLDLLGWRYSKPAVSANLSDSDGDTTEIVRGKGTSPNPIDRAIWPDGYTHVNHPKLCYKQPPHQPIN